MTIHVDVSGEGPDVVLLPGMHTIEHFAPLVERLSRRWRTLHVHPPGYGRSAPLAPYVLDESHTAIEAALAAHGVRAAHLVGFSFGAHRAISHAARGRIVVRSIYALAGFADLTAEESSDLAAYVPVIERGDDLEPVLLRIMLSDRGRADPRAVADVRSWRDATPRADFAREVAAVAGAPDLRRSLAALDIPVTARVGTLDQACPPIRSLRLVAAARSATYEEVPEAGHALLCEDFAATAASIEQHLDALE